LLKKKSAVRRLARVGRLRRRRMRKRAGGLSVVFVVRADVARRRAVAGMGRLGLPARRRVVPAGPCACVLMVIVRVPGSVGIVVLVLVVLVGIVVRVPVGIAALVPVALAGIAALVLAGVPAVPAARARSRPWIRMN
jgi:hypothetical protein